MEGAPTKDKFDQEKCKKKLQKIKGVTKVHDLHAWMINKKNYTMTAHIQYKHDETRWPREKTEPQKILMKATKIVNLFGIGHTTI